ncbi:class I SAM-dependent methyltransferase [Streptomyces rubiginosohelvolus]|uniref:class I SAM-dependent methyltransferase n=1 Tax=Streptomyces rubiginosohelvolus TaxID=67362 RepID=UPI0035DEABE1
MEATNLFYRDPALYDLVQADSTSAAACRSLIERHAPEAASLIDFGCGTGRDMALLSEHYSCVGVDLQPAMVEHARRVRPGLDVRLGDMRTVRLQECADVVVCLGNSLAYAHDNDGVSQVFDTFAAHVRPGGLLVLCSPVSPVLHKEAMRAEIAVPEGVAQVAITYVWDLRTQINTMHRVWSLPSGIEVEDEIHRRVLFPLELERYASIAGFEVVTMEDEAGGELVGSSAYTVARRTR